MVRVFDKYSYKLVAWLKAKWAWLDGIAVPGGELPPYVDYEQVDPSEDDYHMARMLCAVLLYATALFTAYWVVEFMRPPEPKTWPYLKYFEKKKVNRTQVIMDATGYYGSNLARLWKESKGNCSYKNCLFTAKQERWRQADAIVFHCRNNLFDPELPIDEFTDKQIGVFFCLESPPNTHVTGRQYFRYRHRINWTMTYRSDSDIPLTYMNKTNKGITQDGIDKLKSKIYSKKKSVAWMVSRCQTSTHREHYVAELQKYIDVDIYGHCGSLKCSYDDYDECDKMVEQYFFYIALENTLCDEYVTEKATRALAHSTIPIVFSDAIAKKVLPKNSYIALDQFASAKAVVDHLTFLMKNPKQYGKYFKWRKKDLIQMPHMGQTAVCALCEAMQTQEDDFRHRYRFSSTTFYHDILNWWQPSDPDAQACRYNLPDWGLSLI